MALASCVVRLSGLFYPALRYLPAPAPRPPTRHSRSRSHSHSHSPYSYAHEFEFAWHMSYICMAIGHAGQHPPRTPRRRSGEFQIPGCACGGRECPSATRGQLQVAVKWQWPVHKVNGPKFFRQPLILQQFHKSDFAIDLHRQQVMMGSSVAASSVFLPVVLLYGVHLCPMTSVVLQLCSFCLTRRISTWRRYTCGTPA